MNQLNDHFQICEKVNVCSLNIEGISRSKCEVLSKVLYEEDIHLLFLQETHTLDDNDIQSRGEIRGYALVESIHSRVHGIATYIKDCLIDFDVVFSSADDGVFVTAIKIFDITYVNVYKPPSIDWPEHIIHQFQHPAVYMGDFNSHHLEWGYRQCDNNGNNISNFMINSNFHLVYDVKDKPTFHSNVHHTETNPDICFVSENLYNADGAKTKVLCDFPRSQHRPLVLQLGIAIHICHSLNKPRWNFSKANWPNFTNELDHVIQFFQPDLKNYERFVNLTKSIAKKHVPRGFQKNYIPGWDKKSNDLYEQFKCTGNHDIADELLDNLNEVRKNMWLKTTEQLDAKKSSRKFWSLLRKFGSAKVSKQRKINSSVNSNKIASKLLLNSKAKLSKIRSKYVKNSVKKEMRKCQHTSTNYTRNFTSDELNIAISSLKCGKAAGIDGIYTEFIKNFGPAVKIWLLKFFNEIMKHSRIPKEFKRSKILAIVKPGKDGSDPSHYRPIALLSICYKLFERLMLNRIQDKIEESLPKEQAGFRCNRGCTEQVLALTTYIENGFQRQLKTFAAFVDLSSAYDTVWREGLILKLARLIPDRKLCNLMNNMLSNRYFKVYLNDDVSKWKRLNNGLPQGSVLAPLLFNLYISDVPISSVRSRIFMYADDLAIACQAKTFEEGQRILESDINIIFDYYTSWRLKPNPSKTVVSAFHLNNAEANRTLIVNHNGIQLNFDSCPRYLGILLDRTLNFKEHLKKTSLKVRSRNNILQKLCGTNWGASAEVLRLTAISLVNSVADHGSEIWLNSRHVNLIDVQLHESLRIVSGTVRSTPIAWLPVLCNIVPAKFRRLNCLSKLLDRANTNRNSILYDILQDKVPERLVSRKAAWKVFDSAINFDQMEFWRVEWENTNLFNKNFVIDPTVKLKGFDLKRKFWSRLNRIRTGQGRCNYCLHKWNIIQSPECDCGAALQNISHIVLFCPLRLFSGDFEELSKCENQRSIDYLVDLDINL